MSRSTVSNGIMIFDLICIMLATLGVMWMAPFFGPGYLNAPGSGVRFIAAITAVAWIVLFQKMNLDGLRAEFRAPELVANLFLACCTVFLLNSASLFIFHIPISRASLAEFSISLLLLVLLVRLLAVLVFLRSGRSWGLRRAVVLGTSPVLDDLLLRLSKNSSLFFEIVGFLSPEPRDTAIPPAGVSLPGQGVAEFLVDEGVTDLLVLPTAAGPELSRMVSCCRQLGIAINIVPQAQELFQARPCIAELGGIPIISFEERESSIILALIYRLMDIVGACILGVVAIPVLLPCAILIKITRGQWLTTEVRVGHKGRKFRLYRLNIRRRGARLDGFEQMLNELSITELPQLWNVLRGEMRLVGPRPEGLEKVSEYSEWQRQRLRVKPGLTGLAQVHGLREDSSTSEKTAFDLEYIATSSPWRDLSLILQTIWTLTARLIAVFWGRNASLSPKVVEEDAKVHAGVAHC